MSRLGDAIRGVADNLDDAYSFAERQAYARQLNEIAAEAEHLPAPGQGWKVRVSRTTFSYNVPPTDRGGVSIAALTEAIAQARKAGMPDTSIFDTATAGKGVVIFEDYSENHLETGLPTDGSDR